MQTAFREIDGHKPKGFLVDISTTGECEIWFPYSLETMRLISSGVFLAVKNIYSLDPAEEAKGFQHYSILQVVTKSIAHFTIEEMRRMARPMRIQEEFEQVRQDWGRRLKDEENDKLRIIVEAQITDGVLVYSNGVPDHIGWGTSEPVQGEDVYILVPLAVHSFTNAHLSQPGNGGVPIAQHKLYSKVPLCVDYDGLITRHFGVFGYTGAGKSNLVSTLLAKIAHEDERRAKEKSGSGLNLFVFDVNNEYVILLLDQLVKRSDAYIVCLDEGVITGNIRNYMKGDPRYLGKAAADLIASTTAPRDIQRSKDYPLCNLIAENLLANGKVRMFNPYYSGDYTFSQFIVEMTGFIEDLSVPGLGSQRKQQLLESIAEEGRKLQGVNQPVISRMIEYASLIAARQERHEAIANGLGKVFEFIRNKLDEITQRGAYFYGIGRNELMELCHDDLSSLVIFLASSENELRNFAGTFVQDIYQLRKNKGIIEPNVLFFFDEADLFMPSPTAMENADKEERKLLNVSVKACETLARRGRKYGLGLGFATQRTTYLNTTIMGQVGTYFVGRLPRQVDRDTIINSFGSVDESVFTQTAMFGSGSWLVMSHTALARRVPIAIQAENANVRILSFLEEVRIIIEREEEERTERDKEATSGGPDPIFEVTDEEVFAYLPIYAKSNDLAEPTEKSPDKTVPDPISGSEEVRPAGKNDQGVTSAPDKVTIIDKTSTKPVEGNGNEADPPEKGGPNKPTRGDHWEYLKHLISQGEFTRAEIILMLKERYPEMTELKIKQKISDIKNLAYKGSFRLVCETGDGRLVFAE